MNAKQRHFFRVPIICGFLIVALSATSLAASTWYSWGPNYFTPYTGSMGAYSSSFEVTELKWNQTQINSIKNAGGVGFKTLELECRPYSNNPGMETTPVNPNNMWNNPGAGNYDFMSNLPSGEPEFQTNDPDDLAIVCMRLVEVKAETEYYGYLNLTAKPGISFYNRRVLLESEFGRFIAIDSIPTDYEQVFNYSSDSDVVAANTYFGRAYAW